MKVIIEITLKILVLLSILDTTNSQKKNINVTMSTNTNDLSFVNKIMNVLDNQCYNISFNSNNYQNFTHICTSIYPNCCYININSSSFNSISRCFPFYQDTNTIISLPNKNILNITSDNLYSGNFFNSTNLYNVSLICNKGFQVFNSNFTNFTTNNTYSNIMVSSLGYNVSRSYCQIIDPTNNFYKCRRLGYGCCFSKIIYPNNTNVSKCIPADSTTFYAEYSYNYPSTTQIITLNYSNTNYEFNFKTSLGITYKFYCNQDILSPTANNTNLNTYNDIVFDKKNSFKIANLSNLDENDIKCFYSQSMYSMSQCNSTNTKKNCCYYNYKDKNNPDKFVSGCMAYLIGTDVAEFDKIINKDITVSIKCPNTISFSNHLKKKIFSLIFIFIILIF